MMADNLMGQSIPHLRRWGPNQPVDHRQLNEPVDVLNDMTRGVGVPKQVIQPGGVQQFPAVPVGIPTLGVVTRNSLRTPQNVPVVSYYVLEGGFAGAGHVWTGKFYVTLRSDFTGTQAFPWFGTTQSQYGVFTAPADVRTQVSHSRVVIVQSFTVLLGPSVADGFITLPFIRKPSQ